jgi:hypothetical protein
VNRTSSNGDQVIGDAYLRMVEERMTSETYRDRSGNHVGPMRASERRAMNAALTQIAATRKAGEVPCVILELAEDARKEVVIFLGLLPFVQAHLARFPRVLYLAADPQLGARAQLELTSFRVRSHLEFGTWAALADRPREGFKALDLSGCWVIGDIDWNGEPIDETRLLEDRLRGLHRVLREKVPLILVHQRGKKSLSAFPPPVHRSAPNPTRWFARTLLANPLSRFVPAPAGSQPRG